MPQKAQTSGDRRAIIDRIAPQIDCGAFPVKRAVGESVRVLAHVFGDGHDHIRVELLSRPANDDAWLVQDMQHIHNDEWTAAFAVNELIDYHYTVRAWVDHFETWQADLEKKHRAGQELTVELQIGADLVSQAAERAAAGGHGAAATAAADAARLQEWAAALRTPRVMDGAVRLALSADITQLMRAWPDRERANTWEPLLGVHVDRPRAVFSAWYEFFPRSAAGSGQHGTFDDCRKWLPEIADMGFNVVYLPPVHPIGRAHRKGRNNVTTAQTDDPGSPWAIGSTEGGHTELHPQLGDLKSFRTLVRAADENGLEIAMDLAFQCSPDHPYVRDHPQWFKWRPDGTVQYAENPPKKYQDILPLNFETGDWWNLWKELKRVVVYWARQGVRIFRVDNPHTKPFEFWRWLIAETRAAYPDLIFLAEAFTRPKVMARLAKVGFNQSYTYFTWRNTRHELEQYIRELTATELAEYFRPNFWPNTPDILPEYLQHGGRPAFIIRLVLAATLSSNYGVYGPAFELCLDEAIEGREEYLDSEKYEIKRWDLTDTIRPLMRQVNRIRRDNISLRSTRNVELCVSDNENIICYAKISDDGSNATVMVVNLDTRYVQSGWVTLPLDRLGLSSDEQYLMEDGLTGERYIWNGPTNFVQIDPHDMPAHVFTVRRRLRRETDFDYFM
ncbi:MAG: alpha-1,4-glucan--maltose-1-phosphate maltosyltransferase [Spirochaetaceae bacterium]|nr:MAG: alpha-1,4-glucan--maltose-1-phosphate maltosyltransferase [Spirochaetaceae bacterium]